VADGGRWSRAVYGGKQQQIAADRGRLWQTAADAGNSCERQQMAAVGAGRSRFDGGGLWWRRW